MQVFIVGSPLETAKILDKKRLNKQIVECSQILAALNGAKAWSNHPCVLQYKNYQDWLRHYLNTLIRYRNFDYKEAKEESDAADSIRPDFHTDDYFNQMKRRLYTKDNNHYSQWSELGETQENWYWSEKENKYIKYINGKRTN